MVDPTSDLNEDIDEEDAPSCENCGATITASPDHRVVTSIDDGTVRTANFCNDACREDWDGEEP